MKKIISFLLAVMMAFGIFSAVTFAAESEEQSLEEIVREQVEAYAKSIDQPNADKEAADAIASHGMFGRGKDLKIGEDHPLTATLVNSELAKEFLTMLCAELIRKTDELNTNKSYGLGMIKFFSDGKREYRYNIYDYNAKWEVVNGNCNCPKNYIEDSGYKVIKKNNSYDDSLEWIAGQVDTDIDLEIAEIQKDKITYKVNVIFRDRFDFHTSTGSGFGDLISGIGALLFKEFTWYSTFDFQIEIPNDCEHSFGEWKVSAKANCTEKGREERTCINCGCVDSKSTAALGHSFGEWYEAKAPTYFEEGEERRDCPNCDYSEIRTIAALEYLLGDVSGDEKINVIDANLVRRYAAKLAELSEKQLAAADTDGNGKVNVLDANLIRKFAAKIIDEFPAGA